MKLHVWYEAEAILLRNILRHSVYQEMNTLRLIHYLLRIFPTRKPELVFDAIVIHQHTDIDITFLKMIQDLLLMVAQGTIPPCECLMTGAST